MGALGAVEEHRTGPEQDDVVAARRGLAADQPVVVVGDSHADVAKVERLVGALSRRGVLDDHRLILLGDYVDRGPAARELIDLCISLQADGHVFLSGNHEHTLVRALDQHDHGQLGECDWVWRWGANYEDGVLRSYGAVPDRWTPVGQIAALAAAMPVTHRAFLESLPWSLELDGVVALHAGVDHGRPWAEQRADLVARRTPDPKGPAWLHSHRWAADPRPLGGGVTLVTGHKARRHALVAPGRVMVDTGAGDFGGPLSGWISSTGQVVSAP